MIEGSDAGKVQRWVNGVLDVGVTRFGSCINHNISIRYKKYSDFARKTRICLSGKQLGICTQFWEITVPGRALRVFGNGYLQIDFYWTLTMHSLATIKQAYQIRSRIKILTINPEHAGSDNNQFFIA